MPSATPGHAWTVCVWQFDGQCWMMSVHESPDAGKEPSCPSVAWPEKLMASPTAQVRLERGESITGTGGVLFAVTVIGELVVVEPWLSVTWSLTVYVPGVVYVYVGLTAVESP